MEAYPKEIVLLPQALELLLQFPQKLGWIFRGQTVEAWDLIPRAGRLPFFRSSKPIRPAEPLSRKNPTRDLGRFNHWRQLSVGYTPELPDNDFECLAAAQHYGLPTRLLDFTSSALCALYFATEDNFNLPAALYAYYPTAYIDIEVCSLYGIPRVAALLIKPFDKRILSQQGSFIFFPDPSVPLEPSLLPEEYKETSLCEYDLVKFIIPPAGKLMIHRQLVDVGITRRSLFPDLDGLSRDFVDEDVNEDAFNKMKKFKPCRPANAAKLHR